MAGKRTVALEAEDPKQGMTLKELEQFLTDARGAEVDFDTKVRVTIGFSQNIKKLEVTN